MLPQQTLISTSTIDHLAQALARLATSDPESIANTEHSVVSFWPSGQEVADLYTKINGKSAKIKDFTDKDREELRADLSGMGALKVAYLNKWEEERWHYPATDGLHDTSYQGQGIEEVARSSV